LAIKAIKISKELQAFQAITTLGTQ